MHFLILIVLAMTALANPTVTVTTDRGWYSLGDQVTIRISTTGFASSDWLWLYVDKPDGHSLYFTELPARGGTFVVMLPTDAPDGTYTVTVTWDHRYVQTGFIVESQPIPEFPFTPLVLTIAVAVAFATISWRKASASAKTIATHTGAYRVC
jgi:hypothetical protein